MNTKHSKWRFYQITSDLYFLACFSLYLLPVFTLRYQFIAIYLRCTIHTYCVFSQSVISSNNKRCEARFSGPAFSANFVDDGCVG